MEMVNVTTKAKAKAVEDTLLRLRNRALALRLQAYSGLFLIALISGCLIFFLASRDYPEQHSKESTQSQRPIISYKTFEERHNALSDRLDSLIKTIEQQTIYQIDVSKKAPQQIISRYETAINDLKEIRKDVMARVALDRENMSLENRQLRDERDHAVRSKAENGVITRMVGEVALRVGAILMSIYFMSIIANVSKYLMRVADHLNAVADSIDILHSADMDLDKGISSLTPHPIDFHVDESVSLRNIKDFISIFDKNQKS